MNQGSKQLMLQTSSLLAGFMVWVLISSLMPYFSEDIKMSSTEIAWAAAIPVILGSVLRIPIGFWANRYGARKVFTICFTLILFPILLISYANSIVNLLLGGFLLGAGGAVFSIGITSLPKYYSKHRHGFINGIYGAGNIGTAFTTFLAPALANTLGWRTAFRIYLLLALGFAILNFVLGDRQESKSDRSFSTTMKEIYKKPKLWCLSLFYFLTFGSFIAFTIYLPSFLVEHFELGKVDAGLRTAGFIVIATIFRPIGGWLADKMNAFVILITVFFGLTFASFLLSFTPSLPIYSFGCLLVAFCAGIGNGAIFKLVPLYFSEHTGVVSGIVSAFGGLGGFFPPLILTMVLNVTGYYSIGFMSLSEISLACAMIVIWLLYLEKLHTPSQIIEHAVFGICVTDQNGIIQRVNRSFSSITGYLQSEVIGKTPSVLQSGEHDINFYKNMWIDLKTVGYWEGFIWNKRKNQEIYREWLTISAIKDEAGETKNYVGMFSEEIQEKIHITN